jgi:PHD/YefM family antitoxin component YafN of YafNO toxin-antitoxin module
MPKNPHAVLATREARAQLPAMLEHFREAGADAEPVVIGARRRPEAVVLSYEKYLQLAGGRERVRAMLERWAESGEGLGEEEALKLANEEVHAYRRERRSRR